MIRSMREIAAGLRIASDQCHETAASLRTKSPEAAAIAPDVEAVGFTLAMYATVAESIANAEAEPPLERAAEHHGLTPAEHPDVELACVYACPDPIVCSYPHAGCAHCQRARLAWDEAHPVEIIDLIGVRAASVLVHSSGPRSRGPEGPQS